VDPLMAAKKKPKRKPVPGPDTKVPGTNREHRAVDAEKLRDDVERPGKRGGRG
jgi:hypothetical protein